LGKKSAHRGGWGKNHVLRGGVEKPVRGGRKRICSKRYLQPTTQTPCSPTKQIKNNNGGRMKKRGMCYRRGKEEEAQIV